MSLYGYESKEKEKPKEIICPHGFKEVKDVNPYRCSECDFRFFRNHLKDANLSCKLYEQAYQEQNKK